MDLLFSQLPSLTGGRIIRMSRDIRITNVITDSRKPVLTEGSCFFAIAGSRHDGHQFIKQLYDLGVRQFVVEKELDWSALTEASILLSDSTLDVLQKTATFHRQQFSFPVIGITGSNAKTIIKEWLHQLLSPDYAIVKNPGSYNSQLGVPLSVLEIREHHNLGIFEAGISRKGEMEKLAPIIQPTIGLFTNIGSSHDEGFQNREEKISEKLKLFEKCRTLIYCADQSEVSIAARALNGVELIGWGSNENANVKVSFPGDEVRITRDSQTHTFILTFREAAQRENAVHCIILMLYLGLSPASIQSRLQTLQGIPMRLQLKQGVNQCLLIDDTYNNDLAGLHISLDFLAGQRKSKRVVILSDILQSGLDSSGLAKSIATMMRSNSINHFVGIGPLLSANRPLFGFIPETEFFPDTQAFVGTSPENRFKDAVILVKGARPFKFETIVARMERKIHGTVMEVDLAAVVNNLNFFKSRLKPGVRLMVMVKAFAYGSGSQEVASLLQYHRVDYLGVAYPDEGVELRRNHITLPIMVMNPAEESFSLLIDHQLEPEIYSIRILRALIDFLGGRGCKIHLKIDSGMHRLGFSEGDLDELLGLLKAKPELKIVSIFTHLAGSDEAQHDEFTRQQAEFFNRLSTRIMNELGISPVRHVLNSPGILRFPDLQFDMVRLGIGLHGVDPTEEVHGGLQPVATLKTIISQIRQVARGETVGYGRHGLAKNEMKLATIAIGYADGFSRSNSRGVGIVLVNGKRASVVGNVCMDMTMIDITGIDAKEGDEVIIFGQGMPVTEVAARTGTIPYEVLTSTSERVKRIFHTESF